MEWIIHENPVVVVVILVTLSCASIIVARVRRRARASNMPTLSASWGAGRLEPPSRSGDGARSVRHLGEASWW